MGASVIYAAFVASTEGIVGVRDLTVHLINSWMGKLPILFIGLANVVYGIWKVVVGCD